ncbi:MAG TPA: LuxR C-terminal-related transcriptional regulator [Chitinophagaceae bacterium]|nr:LuxR C-terminal-related transcriptional regulator [Chitinophagaceae bacterium]
MAIFTQSSSAVASVVLPYDFMNFLDISTQESSPEFMQNPQRIIKQAFGDINLNSPLAPVILLADFTKKSFVFAHKGYESLTGYTSKYLTGGGIDALFEKLRENDFDIVNNKIFQKNYSVLREINPEEINKYVFSYSYRFKKKDGEFTTILQRLSYLLSPDGSPIGAVGYLEDISIYNDGSQLVHAIEHLNNNNPQKPKQIVYKNYFSQDLEKTAISKRELEVLKWISEGFASKQVAEKLNISMNTVNNHRKKMLQKTNSKNTAELLSFAVLQRLL